MQIKHSKKFESRYGHLSKLLVKKGQKIKRGDLIGKVGKFKIRALAHGQGPML